MLIKYHVTADTEVHESLVVPVNCTFGQPLVVGVLLETYVIALELPRCEKFLPEQRDGLIDL